MSLENRNNNIPQKIEGTPSLEEKLNSLKVACKTDLSKAKAEENKLKKLLGNDGIKKLPEDFRWPSELELHAERDTSKKEVTEENIQSTNDITALEELSHALQKSLNFMASLAIGPGFLVIKDQIQKREAADKAKDSKPDLSGLK